MCNIEIAKDSQYMTLSLIKVHYSTESVCTTLRETPENLESRCFWVQMISGRDRHF